MTDRISEHFSRRELVFSMTAARFGIENFAHADIVRAAERHAEMVLEPLRTACGNRPVSIVSWYRSSALNSRVGGAQHSVHMTGRATDLEVFGLTIREVAQIVCESRSIQWERMIIEHPERDGWIHIESAPPGHEPRRVLMVRRFDRPGYPKIKTVDEAYEGL